MSKISFEEFAREIANDLEIRDGQLLTLDLKDIPQYDSLGKLTVSLTIENLFGFQIDYSILDKADTIHSLYEYSINRANRG